MSRRKQPARKPQQHRPSVVLAYIHPGETSAYFTESMLTTVLSVAAGATSWQLANVLQEWSSANVSSARNTVTQRFLDGGVGEWLLWVDADMQWDPSAVDLLIAAADPVSRPIVGGLCFGMMDGQLFPTIYQWAEIGGEVTTVRLGGYPPNTVMQVAATGAAFILIHRTALERIAERGFSKAFPFFQETELAGKPVGEDLTFCIRAGLVGLPVYVHTGALIGHHKSQLLTEDMFVAQDPPPLGDGVGLVIPTRGDHPDSLRAIIAAAGLPPERVVVVHNGPEFLDERGLNATVLHSTGPLNIHRWWNEGIDLLVERGCTHAAVLNDDVAIAPDTLPKMVRRLGLSTLALLDDGGPSGHCWVLNLTHGVRPDESYRWYDGDFQLIADASRARGVVRVPDAWCAHLHPTEATESTPELVALAAADDALYDSRHPEGSPFAAVRR